MDDPTGRHGRCTDDARVVNDGCTVRRDDVRACGQDVRVVEEEKQAEAWYVRMHAVSG
jgi:hypothetical protein